MTETRKMLDEWKRELGVTPVKPLPPELTEQTATEQITFPSSRGLSGTCDGGDE